MKIIAEAKHIRLSPRKIKLVAAVIGDLKNPQEALTILKFLGKRAAEPLLKVIKSALANAKHNFKLNEKNLIIKEIQINEGPVLKRGRAVSRGRWHRILKRTSHIKVVLEEKIKLRKYGTKN